MGARPGGHRRQRRQALDRPPAIAGPARRTWLHVMPRTPRGPGAPARWQSTASKLVRGRGEGPAAPIRTSSLVPPTRSLGSSRAPPLVVLAIQSPIGRVHPTESHGRFGFLFRIPNRTRSSHIRCVVSRTVNDRFQIRNMRRSRARHLPRDGGTHEGRPGRRPEPGGLRPALEVAPRPTPGEGLAGRWDASPQDVPRQTTPPALGDRDIVSDEAQPVKYLRTVPVLCF